jgi:predicted component of type VI protein secretion system
MPTETPTATPTTETATPVATATTAPAPTVSFSDALDKALGTSGPSSKPINAKAEAKIQKQAPAPKAPEAPKTEAKVEAKTETSSSKTPSSILDQLGTLGIEEKVEAKTEVKSEETIEEVSPEVASTPAAQTAFAKLTKELREAKSKLKEFEGKVSDRADAVEQKGGDVQSDAQLKELQAKLEQFQTERDELEGELRVSKIESTREYKSVIGEPTKAAVQTISDIAKTYEVRPSTILEAVNETDGVKRRTLLKELTGEMDAADALAVRMKVDELVQLNGKREEMLKESKTALEALTRAEEEEDRAERSKYDADAKKAFGEVWGTFQEELPILKKIEGNESWNKTIDELRSHAEKLDAEPLDHRQRAALTYQAVSLPLVVQVFKDYVTKTNQEMKSLRDNLSDYRKATPGAGSGQAPAKSEKLDKGLSFLDALEKGL